MERLCIMKATNLAIFAMTTAIVGVSMARLEVAQSAAAGQEWQRDTAPGSRIEFWILGNAKYLAMQWHARMIAILSQPQEFTSENLRSIFLQLSDRYPDEDFLQIDALSNDSQVAAAKSWFAGIQHFPFGNVRPIVRCASPLNGPLSANYSAQMVRSVLSTILPR